MLPGIAVADDVIAAQIDGLPSLTITITPTQV
jgi:hypothetical protein